MTSARTSSRPRRGLNLTEAALYVGVAPEKFTALVDSGRMPQPRLIDTIRVWDVDEIDVYFMGLPRDQRTALQRQHDRLGARKGYDPDAPA